MDYELRRAARMAMRGVPERLGMQFARGNIEMRAKPNGTGGTAFTWEGYATVYDAPFDMWDQNGEPFTETVAPGAARRSLSNPNLDVPFLIGHNDAGIPLARTKSNTMTLSEDPHGVLSYVPSMDGRREEVRALASAVERGDLDEMSLAFVCTRQSWDRDYEQRTVLEMELHRGDVCAVTHGANSATAGAMMNAVEQLAYRRPAAIGGPVLLGRERRMPTQPYSAHDGEDNTCPQCHSVNDDAASFCDQCGTAMQPQSLMSNMQGVEDMIQRCTSCGGWCSADAKYCGQCGSNLAGSGASMFWSAGRPLEQRAQLSTKAINDLPDSAFALIEAGGKKDSEGKTTPRSLRHYPVQDKGHADDAAARAAAELGEGGDAAAIAKKALPAIHAAQKKFGTGEKNADGRQLERRASAAEDIDTASAPDYNPASPDDPQSADCKTCGGNGRLAHPVTGANGKVCPSCGGQGAVINVDDSTGIPGDEQELSTARRLELRMRELDMEELAR